MRKNRPIPAEHLLWQRYGFAVAAVTVTLMMMLFREGPLAELNMRLLLLSAVMLSSWYGGLGPGVLTTILAAFAIYFYLPRQHYLEIALIDSVRLIEFAIVALLITFLNDKRRRVQRRAEIAQLEAEAATRAKDEFLAAVSHDLRSPLSAVLGWTAILLTKQIDRPESIRALQAIERNATKQLVLIEDLLDVSRSSAGQFRLDVHSIDLADVIEAAIDVLRPAIAAKGLRLQTHVEKNAPSVSGDERRLQQVVWNLLSNAVKFTPESGLISVCLDHTSSHARIIVRDTGSGIAPESLPHVFERFFQDDTARTKQHDGLGLGLAIARQLVELHGGTIEGKSGGEGQGAEFTIQLPLEHASKRGRVGPRVEQPQAASIPTGV